MDLLVVILILIAWAIYGIVQKLTPPDPPFTDEEFNVFIDQLSRIPDPKAKRKFIKQDAARRRARLEEKRRNMK